MKKEQGEKGGKKNAARLTTKKDRAYLDSSKEGGITV